MAKAAAEQKHFSQLERKASVRIQQQHNSEAAPTKHRKGKQRAEATTK